MESSALQTLLGHPPAGDITWWQMCIRAGVVFLYVMLLVRLGGRRLFGRIAAADIILSVIIGSSLSRALTGSAPLLPTLAASTAIVALYWLLAYGARRSAALGRVLKGEATELVREGHADRDAMRRLGLTDADLHEVLREHGMLRLEDVEAAYMERDGSVSMIRRGHG